MLIDRNINRKPKGNRRICYICKKAIPQARRFDQYVSDGKTVYSHTRCSKKNKSTE